MLHEITNLRQANRKQTKRWFSCCHMDLFIWLHKGVLFRFQLAYNKKSIEKMVSWDINLGFRHYLVDTGEARHSHYKQTPLLININEQQDMNKLAYDFLSACENIDTGISDFIYARLMELPVKPAPHNALHTG